MKLTKIDSDFIDLKAEEDGRWVQQAIDAITAKIPIMTSISRKTASIHFSFMGLARHANLAETLIYKSNRFKNTSEVYRAAMYIGMSFLYNLTKDEGTMEQKARANQVYTLLAVMEGVDHSKQIVDAVLLAAKSLIDGKESGVIEFEELEEKMSQMLEALPKGLAKVAKDKIKKIVKGDSIMDITETRISRETAKKFGYRSAGVEN